MSLTRIAPTPSGFLHEGNVLNFVLTAAIAKELALDLALRIDDIDHERVRREYVEDTFRILAWLGIEPTVGPRDLDDLASSWSQTLRIARYWTALEQMADAGLPVFACRCSRTTLAAGRCAAGCRGDLSEYEPAVTRIRWRAPSEDVALWGHDGRPTYHLGNVVDDRDLGTSHVVRGADLAPSTVLHIALTAYLPGCRAISYAHHNLVTSSDGGKLSKSQGTTRLELSNALRVAARSRAAAMMSGVLAQFDA